MKAIMISNHAKWCALMMNGKKTIEVRKENVGKAVQKLIDEQGFADIYVYCSKINKKHYHLIESIDTDTGKTEYEIDYYIGSGDYLDYCYEGKVAFKFRCYKVEKIHKHNIMPYYLNEDSICKNSCLTFIELRNYLKGEVGYAIHISDLEIFDKPKELSEFYKANKQMEYIKSLWNKGGLPDKDDYDEVVLTKAPQSFAYIESEN